MFSAIRVVVGGMLRRLSAEPYHVVSHTDLLSSVLDLRNGKDALPRLFLNCRDHLRVGTMTSEVFEQQMKEVRLLLFILSDIRVSRAEKPNENLLKCRLRDSYDNSAVAEELMKDSTPSMIQAIRDKGLEPRRLTQFIPRRFLAEEEKPEKAPSKLTVAEMRWWEMLVQFSIIEFKAKRDANCNDYSAYHTLEQIEVIRTQGSFLGNLSCYFLGEDEMASYCSLNGLPLSQREEKQVSASRFLARFDTGNPDTPFDLLMLLRPNAHSGFDGAFSCGFASSTDKKRSGLNLELHKRWIRADEKEAVQTELRLLSRNKQSEASLFFGVRYHNGRCSSFFSTSAPGRSGEYFAFGELYSVETLVGMLVKLAGVAPEIAMLYGMVLYQQWKPAAEKSGEPKSSCNVQRESLQTWLMEMFRERASQHEGFAKLKVYLKHWPWARHAFAYGSEVVYFAASQVRPVRQSSVARSIKFTRYLELILNAVLHAYNWKGEFAAGAPADETSFLLGLFVWSQRRVDSLGRATNYTYFFSLSSDASKDGVSMTSVLNLNNHRGPVEWIVGEPERWDGFCSKAAIFLVVDKLLSMARDAYEHQERDKFRRINNVFQSIYKFSYHRMRGSLQGGKYLDTVSTLLKQWYTHLFEFSSERRACILQINKYRVEEYGDVDAICLAVSEVASVNEFESVLTEYLSAEIDPAVLECNHHYLMGSDFRRSFQSVLEQLVDERRPISSDAMRMAYLVSRESHRFLYADAVAQTGEGLWHVYYGQLQLVLGDVIDSDTLFPTGDLEFLKLSMLDALPEDMLALLGSNDRSAVALSLPGYEFKSNILFSKCMQKRDFSFREMLLSHPERLLLVFIRFLHFHNYLPLGAIRISEDEFHSMQNPDSIVFLKALGWKTELDFPAYHPQGTGRSQFAGKNSLIRSSNEALSSVMLACGPEEHAHADECHQYVVIIPDGDDEVLSYASQLIMVAKNLIAEQSASECQRSFLSQLAFGSSKKVNNIPFPVAQAKLVLMCVRLLLNKHMNKRKCSSYDSVEAFLHDEIYFGYSLDTVMNMCRREFEHGADEMISPFRGVYCESRSSAKTPTAQPSAPADDYDGDEKSPDGPPGYGACAAAGFFRTVRTGRQPSPSAPPLPPAGPPGGPAPLPADVHNEGRYPPLPPGLWSVQKN